MRVICAILQDGNDGCKLMEQHKIRLLNALAVAGIHFERFIGSIRTAPAHAALRCTDRFKQQLIN